VELIDLIATAVIAAIVGFIAQAILGFSTKNYLMIFIVGFVGVLLGRWAVKSLGLPVIANISVFGSEPIPIVWSIGGALALAFGVSYALRGKGRGGGKRKKR
jgi:uncharacterized membrane protein YeaQ/YmgE (transglycosylase-associated protein family)